MGLFSRGPPAGGSPRSRGWRVGVGDPVPSCSGGGPEVNDVVVLGWCNVGPEPWGPGWCRGERAWNRRLRTEEAVRGPRSRGDGGVVCVGRGTGE